MTTKGLSSGLAQTKSIYFRAKPPAMMLNTPRQPVIFSLALHYISFYLTPKKMLNFMDYNASRDFRAKKSITFSQKVYYHY